MDRRFENLICCQQVDSRGLKHRRRRSQRTTTGSKIFPYRATAHAWLIVLVKFRTWKRQVCHSERTWVCMMYLRSVWGRKFRSNNEKKWNLLFIYLLSFVLTSFCGKFDVDLVGNIIWVCRIVRCGIMCLSAKVEIKWIQKFRKWLCISFSSGSYLHACLHLCFYFIPWSSF